jgi:hypothetical protein
MRPPVLPPQPSKPAQAAASGMKLGILPPTPAPQKETARLAAEPAPQKETARVAVTPEPMKATVKLSTLPPTAVPPAGIVRPPTITVASPPRAALVESVPSSFYWALLGISALTLLIQLWTYFS